MKEYFMSTNSVKGAFSIWHVFFYTPKHRWVLQILLNFGLLLWALIALVGVIRGKLPGLGGIVMLGGLVTACPFLNLSWASALKPYPGRMSLFVWQKNPSFRKWFWIVIPFQVICFLFVIEPFFSGNWEWAIAGSGWLYLLACLRVVLSWKQA
jgi:hypothetical protein